MENTQNPSRLKQMWTGMNPKIKAGWSTIRSHPWKSMGAGILGTGNLAGLFDNNKIGGQLVGGIGGAVIPMVLNKFAGTKISPYWNAMASMGGGMMGSLFDKLMAKKEKQQQQQQMLMQQYGGFYG